MFSQNDAVKVWKPVLKKLSWVVEPEYFVVNRRRRNVYLYCFYTRCFHRGQTSEAVFVFLFRLREIIHVINEAFQGGF